MKSKNVHHWSVAAVKAQTLSLHGRLQVIGASAASNQAERRRGNFTDTAAILARDRASYLETLRTGHFSVRRGFGKVD